VSFDDNLVNLAIMLTLISTFSPAAVTLDQYRKRIFACDENIPGILTVREHLRIAAVKKLDY
jgi:hypothetical protein